MTNRGTIDNEDPFKSEDIEKIDMKKDQICLEN
jgi:hypothetical protein